MGRPGARQPKRPYKSLVADQGKKNPSSQAAAATRSCRCSQAGGVDSISISAPSRVVLGRCGQRYSSYKPALRLINPLSEKDKRPCGSAALLPPAGGFRFSLAVRALAFSEVKGLADDGIDATASR
ncbi:hypothetical protein E2562_024766 [Oryza meyeriana var. granulata]|uniref:Uncharacterized protein n=1 Tax=Oryza meyeriana var. granulata TaxID=110450 RepID=A0A6G1FBM3_9ORYZ|nr:hypothetical protein E2562_024766 [Oryza meyeriana var. granulata]